MSLVSQARWEFWLGDMPMPADATNETMWAMYEVVEAMRDREYAAEQIKWYESLWRQNFHKYKADQENETLQDIMRLIKQGILYWRERLSDG